MAETEEKAVVEPKGDAAAKLGAVLDSLTRLHGRMDSYEAESKARKDAAEMMEKKRSAFDAARKDKFGKRADGEKYHDWKKRHDADEAAMCDAMRKDGMPDEEAMSDAKRARHDAEEAEKRADTESFEKWAKEEEGEPDHESDKKDARKDGEENTDGKRKEEKASEMVEEEEAKKDSGRRIAGLEAQLAEMRAALVGMTAEQPAAERDALAAAQARHDAIAARLGDRAPAPVPGESSLAYRRRLLARIQRHSPRFKETSLAALDSAALGAVEEIVHRDAIDASSAVAQAQPGHLIAHVSREGGRDITRYDGDPMAWMQHFMTGAQVGHFRQKGN